VRVAEVDAAKLALGGSDHRLKVPEVRRVAGQWSAPGVVDTRGLGSLVLS
jgi:hypothetical protein